MCRRNRKLVVAPSRPRNGQIPALDHLRDAGGAKADFGVYNALAVMGYLVGVLDPECDWPKRAAACLMAFPTGALSTKDMGVPEGWENRPLWNRG